MGALLARSVRVRPLAMPAALLLAAGLAAACVSPTPSPLIGLRPQLGGLALASMAGGLQQVSDLPAKGENDGAVSGAGEGLKLGLYVMARGAQNNPGGLLLSVPLGAATAIVAAPVGAIIGAAKARSPAEVEAAERTIRTALTQMAPHPRLAEALRAQPPMARVLASTAIAEPGAYRALAEDGVGTVIEIGAERYGFEKVGLGASNPDYQFRMVARVRLVRAADNAELYVRAFAYFGSTEEFFTWAERDGALVRAELAHAYRELAAYIARHLLSDPDPEQWKVVSVHGKRRSS
jgi:hypothetical protein